jgi:molybdenum cofactor cytidylyltransferase
VGIRFLTRPNAKHGLTAGALFALGDQPHVPVSLIADVVAQARHTPESIVIPSYAMRRGHPFFIPAHLWSELLELGEALTLRDFLRRHEQQILYVESATDAILRDMDTPDDYAALASDTLQ